MQKIVFQSTSPRGLDHDSVPMRLWHKAKRLGVWDPREIDFTTDATDWDRLGVAERDVILHLTSLFQAGEESVTRELLPLIMAVGDEGNLEEEMYLTSFLWEEAKHVEAFARFLEEVVREPQDLTRYHTPSYRRIFHEELPAAMRRLRADPSPVALAEASVTYNMIVEGVLAETGYRAYDELLRRNGILPGMQRVVTYLRRDEARHLAYGVHLLGRLIREHGDPVREAIQRRLGELVEPALTTVTELFAWHDPMPFGLRLEDFAEFAMSQFQARVSKLEAIR